MSYRESRYNPDYDGEAELPETPKQRLAKWIALPIALLLFLFLPTNRTFADSQLALLVLWAALIAQVVFGAAFPSYARALIRSEEPRAFWMLIAVQNAAISVVTYLVLH
ncbi:hypothetical protein G7076_09365 [Sphingomonas sp. HDW15A]|uniref:hypothetical protein n=1 Tax=Sphingomonas sp. HDW15A TaxID=2714942 RepID=UPI00140825DC|nr:hypothetical protein [Sphingomonas sp. HDW15A]QIK96616.1 hypothetical protein G7076_09365 [Sphingomonas sp. HDW15A]